jgi:hypothetical protein
MTPEEILRLRQRNQGLDVAAFRKPEEVVAWFGAVQAQDYLGALWALGLRTRAATEASVEAAEARRAIVRTWPMRGTLHFVAAADARWMTQLLAPRVLARIANRLKRDVDVDAVVVRRAREVVTRVLDGGKRLERRDLYAALDARRIRTTGSRGLHILLWLAMEGTICLAGRQGKQHTFALLDQWIPASKPLDREAALGELARRYFTSHGPATQRDFMWWAGITAKDAQAAIDAAGSALAPLQVDGNTYWWREARGRRRAGRTPAVKLLPSYDEFTVAYHDRSLLTTRRPSMGLLGPVVVIDGRVVGDWRRTLRDGKSGEAAVSVRARLRRALSREEHTALADEIRGYARFLGRVAD